MHIIIYSSVCAIYWYFKELFSKISKETVSQKPMGSLWAGGRVSHQLNQGNCYRSKWWVLLKGLWSSYTLNTSSHHQKPQLPPLFLCHWVFSNLYPPAQCRVQALEHALTPTHRLVGPTVFAYSLSLDQEASRDFPGVQWLGLVTPNAGSTGSTLVGELDPHACCY